MKVKNNLFYSFLPLFTLLLVSCGSKDAKWDETADGVKIYHNTDQSLISKTSIKWIGDTTYFGLAHGKGEFVFIDDYDEEKNIKKTVIAQYGSLESFPDGENFTMGEIDDKGRLNGFGVRHYGGETIIGEAKKGNFKGYGVILKNDILYYKGNLKKSYPNGKGISYFANGNKEYSGNWKEGFFNGKGILYYENGVKKYEGKFKKNLFDGKGVLYNQEGQKVYEGKWKNGEYNGYGELFTGNGVVKHVWSNGGIDKTTQKYYNLLETNKGHFTPEQYEKIIERAVSWEKHHVWYYIILWISVLIICLIFVGMTEGTIEEDPFMEENKWKVLPSYLQWLLLGWIGFHRSMLRSRLAYIFIGCFILIIALETRDIIHFLFWPSTWFMWHPSVITICALGVIGLMLVEDIFWIPWRVYVLNRKYYYSDKYEKEIMEGVSTFPVKITKNVPVIATEASNNFPVYLTEARQIKGMSYQGRTGFFAQMGRAVTGNSAAVDFEMDKLKAISKVGTKATNLYNEFAEVGENLNNSLEQQRIAAKKNLDIVSHLFQQMMKYKNKKRGVNTHEHEVIKDIRLDETRIEDNFMLEMIEMPEIGVDWDRALSDSYNISENLFNSGVGIKWSIGLGVAAGVVSHISDAMKRENQAREQAVMYCNEVVNNLKEIVSRLNKTEANMMRGNEILKALIKANEAFTHAYIPVRNQVYGSKISFVNFLRGERGLANLVSDKEFMKAAKHLKDVCVEYNKINQTTIK